MNFDEALKQQVAEFRREFGSAATGGPNAHLTPIKDICLVGGIPDPEDGRHHYDVSRAADALKLLVSLNIPLSQSLSAYMENIDPQYGGFDFLESRKPADIAIVLDLFNPEPWEEHDVKKGFTGVGKFQVSQKHFDDGVWHKSASARNVKLIAHFGHDGLDTMGPRRFLESGSLYTRLSCTKQIDEIWPHGHWTSQPYLLVHRDYKIA